MADGLGSGPALALLVGGGPAPGINGVIAAATIEARNRGARVIGVLDGFEWLSRGDTQHVMPLEIRDVSRIHFRGGSILRTSRTNPTKDAAKLENVVRALARTIESGLRRDDGDPRECCARSQRC